MSTQYPRNKGLHFSALGLQNRSERFATVCDFWLAEYALRCKPDAQGWARFGTLWRAAWHALVRFGSETATVSILRAAAEMERWRQVRAGAVRSLPLPSTVLVAGSGVETWWPEQC